MQEIIEQIKKAAKNGLSESDAERMGEEFARIGKIKMTAMQEKYPDLMAAIGPIMGITTDGLAKLVTDFKELEEYTETLKKLTHERFVTLEKRVHKLEIANRSLVLQMEMVCASLNQQAAGNSDDPSVLVRN